MALAALLGAGLAHAQDGAAACVDETDFRPGTVLRIDYRQYPADAAPTAATTGSRTERVEGRRAFAGAKPLAVTMSGTGMADAVKYVDRVGNRALWYGTSTAGNATEFRPPSEERFDLRQGESMKGQLETVSAGIQIGRTEYEVSYLGRVPLQTPLGRIETCHFRNVSRHYAPQAKEPVRVEGERWVAAEGPYRGQTVRTVNPPSAVWPKGNVWEAIKIERRPG